MSKEWREQRDRMCVSADRQTDKQEGISVSVSLLVTFCPPSTPQKYAVSVVFSFLSFLHQIPQVCVCQQHCCLSPFPSEVFGQLWLVVCITEVATLTSCLIPGPLSLIDGQSKHCGLEWSDCARACASVCLAVNKHPRLIPTWSQECIFTQNCMMCVLICMLFFCLCTYYLYLYSYLEYVLCYLYRLFPVSG